VGVDGWGREAVCKYEGDFVEGVGAGAGGALVCDVRNGKVAAGASGFGGQALGVCVAELAAEIRALQVGLAIGGLAVNDYGWAFACALDESGRDLFGVKGLVDGVAGAGVR
jgi:hypothetical protein